jgi:hypothetical protein
MLPCYVSFRRTIPEWSLLKTDVKAEIAAKGLDKSDAFSTPEPLIDAFETNDPLLK